MFTDAKLVDDAGTTFGSSVNPACMGIPDIHVRVIA